MRNLISVILILSSISIYSQRYIYLDKEEQFLNQLSTKIKIKYGDLKYAGVFKSFKVLKLQQCLLIGSKIPIYSVPYNIHKEPITTDIIQYKSNIDTVLLPLVEGHSSLFIHDDGDASEGSFLIITKDNILGFVRSQNILLTLGDTINNDFFVPNSDFLIISPNNSSYKKIVVNIVTRENWIIEARDFTFTSDGSKILISLLNGLSIDRNLTGKIYLYDPKEKKSTFIQNGYSPSFINDSLFIFFKDSYVGNKLREFICLYSFNNNRLKCSALIPDTLTFKSYYSEGDICLSRFINKYRRFELYKKEMDPSYVNFFNFSFIINDSIISFNKIR